MKEQIKEILNSWTNKRKMINKTKITIEMTCEDGEEFSTTVTGEALKLDEVAQLMARALLGQGFSYEAVRKLIDCEI